jgi:hypothetical protein
LIVTSWIKLPILDIYSLISIINGFDTIDTIHEYTIAFAILILFLSLALF